MATDTVIDVALFLSGDDLVVMASCDSMLRLFSHKVRMIIYHYYYDNGYHSNRR